MMQAGEWTGRGGGSRYRFEKCIASGAMGAVYLGVRRGAAGFERPVAIKRTHAHLLETPEIRQAILTEARHASAVRHANVVSIDDVEEVDGELLLVMDYVDGSSLSQLLESGRVPLGVVISVVLDACAGLHAIHTAKSASGAPLGLVHRDVSPQNILVGLDGIARVTDFGIAKGSGDPRRTSKTTRRGKFGYMAPEYLISGALSSSSDIFGLGIVLWEALAGRRLFAGDSNMDSIRLTIDGDVPSLHAMNPSISPKLDSVVRKALARDPRERFASMAELGRRLEEVALDLVASRPEVAAHVQIGDDVRPCIQPPQQPELVTAVTEVLSTSAVFTSSLDAVPCLSDLLPPDDLSIAPPVHRLPAPPRVPVSTRPKPPRVRAARRGFRREEGFAGSDAARKSRPTGSSSSPLVNRLGLAVFFMLVVSSTAALAYAGLGQDTPQQTHAGRQ